MGRRPVSFLLRSPDEKDNRFIHRDRILGDVFDRLCDVFGCRERHVATELEVKEFEGLRKQARTLEGPILPECFFMRFSFTKREEFGRRRGLILLKVKSKGSADFF